MNFVKLNKRLEYHQSWYTDKPILVIKRFKYYDKVLYQLNIDFAGLPVNVNENDIFIDKECVDLIRTRKLERLIE